MTNPIDIDAELVRKLANLLDETKLTEIEYGWGELRLRVARHAAPVHAFAAGPAPTGVAVESATLVDDLSAHPGAVRSPMVGTAYLSPQPGALPYVRVGDTVAMGDTLLIIEAMKVMNQIRAPKAGRVARILVQDSGPVEFGQVMIVLD
jgi:acetyl-CoA carboxylase biotin carboxyl carrier protein